MSIFEVGDRIKVVEDIFAREITPNIYATVIPNSQYLRVTDNVCTIRFNTEITMFGSTKYIWDFCDSYLELVSKANSKTKKYR